MHYFIAIFSLLFLSFTHVPEIGGNGKEAPYPDFATNPYLTSKMRLEIRPYLIPLDHPAKPILDAIFLSGRVQENEQTFTEAGFTIVYSMQSSFVKIARHPLLPGYLIKLYLDNETRLKKGRAGWSWLKDRCKGANRLREYIKKKKIRHFVVPDKWLYALPSAFPTAGPIRQPVVLLVTDMELVSHDENRLAWMTLSSTDVLDELYMILRHGSGSWFLTGNVPYTRSGKFAFVDTEYPKRDLNLEKVKNYISEEMQIYWDSLIN
jgi:hypothetical protein